MLWLLLVIVCVQVLLACFSYEERNVNGPFFSTQTQRETRIGNTRPSAVDVVFFIERVE